MPRRVAARSARLLLPALLSMSGLVAHAQDAAPAPADAADVQVLNRPVATFRSELLGNPPALRAEKAERRIAEQLAKNPSAVLDAQPNPAGVIFTLDGVMVFVLTPGDADVLTQETLDQAVAATKRRFEVALRESRETRNADFLLRAAGTVLLATAALAALIWLLYRLRRLITGRLVKLAGNADLAVGGVKLLTRERIIRMFAKLSHLLFVLVAAVLAYEWLSLAMAQFPYTRPWGEGLHGFLFGMLAKFGKAILGAIPDLLTAAFIFLLAYGLTRVSKGLFDQIASGRARLGDLDAELAGPTRKLVSAVIWIFALVMAYPYLPGSDSDAFKGVSVLLGLMLSLGSSSVISQGASGLILTFTRTFRVGEYVRIDVHEGTVSALGIFNTRLRTGMGEEVTLSNAGVLSSVIRNYSRTTQGQGYVLDTTVTIGYDTPWRQVEAMLLEAAAATSGIAADPPPRVFQTALSDFYPEYRLVCNATAKLPRPRALALSDLHANIQDTFNKYGVQIMSPHYMKDPQSEKTVSEDRKYAAPAKRPE